MHILKEQDILRNPFLNKEPAFTEEERKKCNTNRTLFYYTIRKHVTEFLPIIYTPHIGDAVINYSRTFDTPKDAVFLSVDDTDNIKSSLK